MDLPKKSYQYQNVNIEIGTIFSFDKANRIDTNLDCQRGYVWTEEQKQQLIDTLIHSERIPEFHAIKEADEAIYHFADGKQRITTILNFLKGNLEWKKTEEFKELFPSGEMSIKFSDLPNNFQNLVLNTPLSFAVYSGMTPLATIRLFRKLNNGTALGEFQKTLAENIHVKKYFLDELMDHPVISRIFSTSRIERGNAEQALLRAMILMRHHDAGIELKGLRPPDLKSYFLDIEALEGTEEEKEKIVGCWIASLTEYKDKIKKYLNWLHVESSNLMTRADYVSTFSIYFAYKESLDEEAFRVLFKTLQEIPASSIISGSGADYSSSNVLKYIDYIHTLLHGSSSST